MANWKAGVAIALLVGSGAEAQRVRPGKADIASVVESGPSRSYPEAAVEEWERDLREALSRRTPEQASAQIAGRYGFSASEMRRLVDAWIIAQARQYGDEANWKPAVRAELLALAPSVRRVPLGLTIVAEALEAVEDCSAADFGALMAGAADAARDAYLIAVASACTGNFNRAAVAAGDRAMPVLIRYAQWGSLPPRDTIALYAWLTSPPALARVADADRAAVSALLWRRYLAALLKYGLDKRALALFDAMPGQLRVAVMSESFVPPKTAMVDGIAMTLAAAGGRMRGRSAAAAVDAAAAVAALEAAADRLAGEPADSPRPAPSPSVPEADTVAEAVDPPAPILEVAEALAAAGRDAEARAMLARLPGLAAAKAAASCIYASEDLEKATCPRTSELPMRALVLDHLLNTPEPDPYPIAEVVLTSTVSSEAMASAAVRCLVFPEKDFPDLCAQAKVRAVAGADLEADGDAETAVAREASLERSVSGFRDLRAAARAEAVVQPADRSGASPRASMAAQYPPFAEKAVPAEYRGNAKGGLPKGLAALPDGFDPVRIERQGRRVVAISVSQTYDPTGEISRGGYWVHLSDDAGAHWQRPLYTGLADRFPYVVAPSSRLPLIDGDALNLAVDIAEIDTASITYPPVGLRTRRRAQDRYLAIPIADLQRDSDGDGLTDLAAHHLLLDRPRGSSGTPFMVGSDRGVDCRAPVSPERLALTGLLGKLTDPGSAAIVEPVDRKGADIGIGWQRAGAAVDQPLFILGRAEDYACLRAARPMIVYGEDDIPLLERFTPHFHAFQLPPILFNRARNRGFVNWSTGWAGGTYRLRLIDGHWKFDTIQSWIT